MNNKLVPALMGGAIVGILSTIFGAIPIPFIGLCCCLWGIGGGALAVMVYVKKSPTQVTMGEGAMLGAMAGVIGGIIYFVLMSIIGVIIGAEAYEAQMRQYGGSVPISGVALVIMAALMGGIFLAVLSTVGGLIGIPIFEKRKDGGAPPPPPPFGGQPGAGGQSGAGGYAGGTGSNYGSGT